MARTAGDLALLLGVMAGRDPRDPLSQRDARRRHSPRRSTADLQGRRVAWSPDVGGLPLEPACPRCAGGRSPAARRDRPHGRATTSPTFDGADEVFETWRAFMSATGLGDEYDARGDDMKATVRAEVERGRALTSAQLTRATRLQAELAERALAFFDRYDYLACPVTQVDPFPIEQEYAAEIDGVRDGLLHRVDALQLAHQRDRMPGDLRAGRLLARRACPSACSW